MAAEIAVGQRIAGLEYILTSSGKTPDQWVDETYSPSKLKDQECRLPA